MTNKLSNVQLKEANGELIGNIKMWNNKTLPNFYFQIEHSEKGIIGTYKKGDRYNPYKFTWANLVRLFRRKIIDNV